MTRKQFIEDILPFSERIYRVSYRLLRDSEKARDMVQNIFCKLWDGRDNLRRIQNMEAYLMKITRNACLDSLRLRKFTTEIEQHHRVAEPGYEAQESARLVKKVIATLPERQRIIIELRDIEGLSFEAISELLDIHPNAIRASLSMARKKVREEVQKIYSYGT